MSRLSKYTRDAMAKALTKHRFADKAGELTARSVELFNAVLDERYDAETQKLMKKLEKRHPGAFAKTDTLYLRAQGLRVTVGAASVGYYSVAVWEADNEQRSVLHEDDGEPSRELASHIVDFAMEAKAFNEELVRAHQRALAALEQFTTGKKLAEGWPEAMPVIGHLIPVEDRTLPTVQLEALNHEFDLPPSEMEAA